MARQVHTPTSYHSVDAAYAGNAADVVMTAADVGNFEECAMTGAEIVIVHNTSGASAYTVTFESVTNENNRTGDITTYSIGIGEYAAFGPFPLHGWRQTGGKLYFRATNAAVKFGVYRIQ